MSEVIWHSELDDVFLCRVVRTGEYTGNLTVKHGDKVLLEQEVGLSYGALLGPDISDVAEWQDLCIQCVDSQQET